MPYGLRTDMFATRKIHRTRLRNLVRLGWPPLLRACGGSLAGRRVPLRRELMLRCRATLAPLFAFAVPAAFSRSPVHFSRPRSSPRFPVHLAGPVRLSTYDKPSLSPLSRPPGSPRSCPRALRARSLGGGRTDSDHRTSRLNIASRLTSPCRRCGLENVARNLLRRELTLSCCSIPA
jgi:hypothetical protein